MTDGLVIVTFKMRFFSRWKEVPYLYIRGLVYMIGVVPFSVMNLYYQGHSRCRSHCIDISVIWYMANWFDIKHSWYDRGKNLSISCIVQNFTSQVLMYVYGKRLVRYGWSSSRACSRHRPLKCSQKTPHLSKYPVDWFINLLISDVKGVELCCQRYLCSLTLIQISGERARGFHYSPDNQTWSAHFPPL